MGCGGASISNLPLALHDVVTHDRLVTAGADTDVGDGGAGELFEPQHVILRLLRQLLERGAALSLIHISEPTRRS